MGRSFVSVLVCVLHLFVTEDVMLPSASVGPSSCLYLVNRGELCADRPSMESGAVPESPRGPLPAAVQHPAGGLLSVQRSSGRFVSSELGATLSVTMWGARLPMQAVVAAGS